MAVMQATIPGLKNDQRYGVRAFIRSPNGWQTAPDANGFCTPMTFSPILSQNSWAQIDAASRAGLAPTLWKVGDEKDITLTTGERLTLQIYGFNHDDLTGGGKAGITFGHKVTYAGRRMNSTNTNYGGFTGSEMYSWLQNTALNRIPEELRAVLKYVNKKTSAGNSSSAINTNSMKLFLPSEIEYFGSIVASAPGEGSKYAIFTDDNSRSSVNHLWTRSPHRARNDIFCYVDVTGTNKMNQGAFWSDMEIGYRYGFCV